MLSFSTKGSAQHEHIDKVIEATRLIKEKRPDLKVDGELQFDTAVVDSVGRRKAPTSDVAGRANVLIFLTLMQVISVTKLHSAGAKQKQWVRWCRD
jgi:phosphate acetyltransferase